jgi:hypothetical protein
VVPGKEFAGSQHKIAQSQETLPPSEENPPSGEIDCRPTTSASNAAVAMFSNDHGQNVIVGSGDPNSTFVLISKASPKPSTSTCQPSLIAVLHVI